MAVVEYNISGVKLERIRRKACRRTVILRTAPKVVFAAGALFSLLSQGSILWYILKERNWQAFLGAIGMIVGGWMLSFCVAALFYGVYFWLFWKKPYEFFNQNYKNRYAPMKLREVPGFSEIKYSAKEGIALSELSRVHLLPGSTKSLFQSGDAFSGVYQQVRFRAGSVETFEAGKSSLPVFSGMVMVFSMFHEIKISSSPLQIFPRKQAKQMQGLTLPIPVEVENEAFNQQFCVFAEDAHNAFYILTPAALEKITAFAAAVPQEFYLSFSGPEMYVGCGQLRNPFDAVVDLPVEEQSRNIAQAAELIRLARTILVQMGTGRQNSES